MVGRGQGDCSKPAYPKRIPKQKPCIKAVRQLSTLRMRPREGGGHRESLTSKLSQMPLATFPRVLASRGATSMRSAHLRRSMWRTGSDRCFHIWRMKRNGVAGQIALSVCRGRGWANADQAHRVRTPRRPPEQPLPDASATPPAAWLLSIGRAATA